MTDFDSDFDPVSLASFSDQADEAAEDLTMKALRGRDLHSVCLTCYGVYIDSQDILLRLDEYRQSE